MVPDGHMLSGMAKMELSGNLFTSGWMPFSLKYQLKGLHQRSSKFAVFSKELQVWISGKRGEESRIQENAARKEICMFRQTDWPIKFKNKHKCKSKTKVNFFLIYQENYNVLLSSER